MNQKIDLCSGSYLQTRRVSTQGGVRRVVRHRTHGEGPDAAVEHHCLLLGQPVAAELLL